jgi:hypothetical protein
MLTITLVFLALGAGFLLGFFAKPDQCWRVELPPEDQNRGPNADSYYEAVTVGGEDHWFTVEQVCEAKLRAEKYKR